MPVARFQMPDGRVGRFEVPEGTSPEQAIKMIGEHLSGQGAPTDPVSSAINKSGTAGVLDAGLSLASGMVAAPAAGVAGLVQGAKNLVAPGMEAGSRVHQVQDAMTYEPRTDLGKGLVRAVGYPFEKLAELGNAQGEKTAEKTGSPAVGAGVNTAIQALPLVLGRVAPGEGVAASAAKANALRLKNAPADTAVATAKDAGYVLPPTQANPSIWNKIVEGFGGKIKTAQDASLKNQEVTNGLVRQGLGLAEDAPLNAKTLSDVRKTAGRQYENVRGAGTVTADSVYLKDLDSIAAPFERAAKDFPDAARKDIIDAVKAARRDSFEASSAVDQISILRDKADTAYRASDKKLGKAYKDIADSMEEQLGRHLEESGYPMEALQKFRDARQTIAKTYTVQKHLNETTGSVDAVGLANDLKRSPGKLSGDIKTAAEFGRSFPKAANTPEKVGGVPMSPLDHAFSLSSIAGAVASGHPMLALAALAPYARPLARKMMTSEGYQNTFVKPPQYGPSTMSRLQQLQAAPAVQAAEMAEAQRQ